MPNARRTRTSPRRSKFARGNNQVAGMVNAGMSSGFRFAIGATRLTGAPPSSAGDLSLSAFAWWLALS